MVVNILFGDSLRTSFFIGDLPRSLKLHIMADKQSIYADAKAAMFLSLDRHCVDVRREYDGVQYIIACSLGKISPGPVENDPVRELWILDVAKG